MAETIDTEAAEAWAKLDEGQRNVLRNADPPIMEADIGPADRKVWSLCSAGLLQWGPQGCSRTPLGNRTLAHGMNVRCTHCGAPATCVGRYESVGDDAPWEPACDTCCGHGCEDGRCHPMDSDQALRLVAAQVRRG